MFYEENYYHIYNRGLNKADIFFNTDNYIYCLKLLKKYCRKLKITVIAHCLMPNHYHFLMRQNSNISISKLIQNVFNSYVQAINKKMDRKGTLFEGKYKYVHVDDDAYLLHLCRYIHLNPVEAGLSKDPAGWPFSNYQEWIGLRKGSLKDPNLISQYFSEPKEYKKFVIDYQHDKKAQQRLSKYLLD